MRENAGIQSQIGNTEGKHGAVGSGNVWTNTRRGRQKPTRKKTADREEEDGENKSREGKVGEEDKTGIRVPPLEARLGCGRALVLTISAGPSACTSAIR